MDALRQKALRLTHYLAQTLESVRSQTGIALRIITPQEESQRGCQLSVVIPEQGRRIFDYLTAHGVVADWREPDVIRLAPVPLYNSYTDVHDLGQKMIEAIKENS
jgi:kynureninase